MKRIGAVTVVLGVHVASSSFTCALNVIVGDEPEWIELFGYFKVHQLMLRKWYWVNFGQRFDVNVNNGGFSEAVLDKTIVEVSSVR